jgi:hypothetical protein
MQKPVRAPWLKAGDLRLFKQHPHYFGFIRITKWQFFSITPPIQFSAPYLTILHMSFSAVEEARGTSRDIPK